MKRVVVVDKAETYKCALASLIGQLEKLEWDVKKGKKVGFTVPARTLLQEAGRPELYNKSVASDKTVQTRIIDVLKKAEKSLATKIDAELGGGLFALIPVLDCFTEFARSGKKRQAEESVAVSTPPACHQLHQLHHHQPEQQQQQLQLRTIPGARACIRASVGVTATTTTIEQWIESYLEAKRQPILPDRIVGEWLLFCNPHSSKGSDTYMQGSGTYKKNSTMDATNPELITKALRLYDVVRQRKVLIIFDVVMFCAQLDIPIEKDDRTRLANVVALKWKHVKGKLDQIYGGGGGAADKQTILNDIISGYPFTIDEWNKISGSKHDDDLSHIIATTDNVLPHFAFDAAKLNIARMLMGIKVTTTTKTTTTQVQRHFFGYVIVNESGATTVTDVDMSPPPPLSVVVMMMANGTHQILLHGSPEKGYSCLMQRQSLKRLSWMLNNDQLPSDVEASRVFRNTGNLPNGLSFDAEVGVITLNAHPHVKLHVEWYRHKTGIIDFDQLFEDAFGLLRHGAAAVATRQIPFSLLIEELGLMEALQRVVELCFRNHITPTHTIPIFDLQHVPTTTSQNVAFQLYRLTGRYANRIVGFYNKLTGAKVFLSNICVKKRQTGRIDEKNILDEIIKRHSWITPVIRRVFSSKEICFLLASIFVHGPNIEEAQKTLIMETRPPPLQPQPQHQQQRVSVREMMNFAKDHLINSSETPQSIVLYYIRRVIETEGPFMVFSPTGVDVAVTNEVLCCQPDSEMPSIQSYHSCDGNRMGEFKRFMRNYSRQRNFMLPHVPCVVRIRETGDIMKLVVFNYEQDSWHIWNGKTITQFKRCDFDVLENRRCLPAPVVLLNPSIAPGFGVAIKCLSDSVIFVVDLGQTQVKMTYGIDFTWKESAFYDPKVLQHQTCASERTPELVDDVFNEDSAFVYQILDGEGSSQMPTHECNDWAMREFFNKQSACSIWPFLKFFQISVPTDVLYHVFYLQSFEHEKSWATRCRLHVNVACQWFWQKILDSDIEYDHMVWQTKLKSQTNVEPAVLLQNVMKQIYN